MRRLIFLALAVALAFPLVGDAQTAIQRATLMYAFDLNGEAADANQIVEQAGGLIVDNGTSVEAANYTITAQPDSCRLIDMTISDTNMSAGTITVTGVGCLGEAKVCTWSAWTAGDDDGVKTLTCADGDAAYMSSITSVTTGLMTGEDDEYFLLGYTSNSVNGWGMFGTKQIGPNGELEINPFGYQEIPLKVTTSAVLSTTVAGVTAADDPFTRVSVGDLLVFTLDGVPYERKVTAKASVDSITVNKAINIPAVGTTFRLRPWWFSTNPNHELYIPVNGYKSLVVNWSMDACSGTGGCITLFECTDARQPDWPTTPWVQISTTTTVDTGTKVPTAESVDLVAKPYLYCRWGLRFGTGDTAGTEDFNASIALIR